MSVADFRAMRSARDDVDPNFQVLGGWSVFFCNFNPHLVTPELTAFPELERVETCIDDDA
jgi:hypothetical protein